MAETIDYGLRWTNLLTELAGKQLADMPPDEKRSLFQSAARNFLLACYGDQVREELGPLVSPANDIDVLRVRAAHIHHWKFGEAKDMSKEALVAALSEELAHFTLPAGAYRTARERLASYSDLQEMLAWHAPEPQV